MSLQLTAGQEALTVHGRKACFSTVTNHLISTVHMTNVSTFTYKQCVTKNIGDLYVG